MLNTKGRKVFRKNSISPLFHVLHKEQECLGTQAGDRQEPVFRGLGWD